MASKTRPQFFPNDLKPIAIDEPTLRKVLDELRAAVRRGITLIQSRETEKEDSGTIFSGSLGIAIMFLRLEEQAPALADYNYTRGEFEPTLPDFQALAKENIKSLPGQKIAPGEISPICSPTLGACVTRILATTGESDFKGLTSKTIKDDIEKLNKTFEIAILQGLYINRHGHSLGGDELLYGRVGLLWALGNINRHSHDIGISQRLQLMPGIESKLWHVIMEAGRKGSEEYARANRKKEALPLMWPWHDEYYGLGAMHGIAGILTILLGYECSKSDYEAIGRTITGLCKVCISHNGHLPTSIPPRQSSRPSPLVQICHGAPALLLLLATAKRIPGLDEFHTPEWDDAVRLGSERIWEEGVLSKGGGICHGITGNAWPWLMLYEKAVVEERAQQQQPNAGTGNVSPQGKLSADDLLSKALTFLLAAKDTPPFAKKSRFRMPDRPFSLFEGLAGTICAWSEACAIIKTRLQQMEGDSTDVKGKFDICRTFGFPGLGGAAVLRSL